MNYNKITINNNNLNNINVIVEIPMNSCNVKYEFDVKYQCMTVDRFMKTSLSYPINYGFIPHTKSDDNDPIDAMIFCHFPIISQCIIKSRPIGMLKTEDEKGQDVKILCVPISKIDNSFDEIQEYTDIGHNNIKKIEHFFIHYKELDKNKYSRVLGWEGANKARETITKYTI